MEMTSPYFAATLAISLTLLTSAPLNAQNAPKEYPQATLQHRFAPKAGRLYAHIGGASLLRDDFYHTLGYGLDAGYHLRENIGLELRALKLHTWLSDAAQQLRQDQNLLPDLRQPQALFALGLRLYGGYGKLLSFDRFVIHFDPQLNLHGGITLAEERTVPTILLGTGFVTHLRHGIQVKLDLQMTLQMEKRLRGWTPALGFLPILGVGWSPRSPLWEREQP